MKACEKIVQNYQKTKKFSLFEYFGENMKLPVEGLRNFLGYSSKTTGVPWTHPEEMLHWTFEKKKKNAEISKEICEGTYDGFLE